MRTNKVDQQGNEASPIEQLHYKSIVESQDNPIETVLEEMKKSLNEAPTRKMAQFDVDILQNHIFDDDKADSDSQIKSLVDFYNKIPKERFIFQDLTEQIQEFKLTEDDQKDIYFKSKIDLIQDWDVTDNKYKNKTRKYSTKSELIQIDKTNEKYLVLYQIQQMKKENETAYLTNCYIYKFDSEQNQFELTLQFLADINTKGDQIRFFNRVFINESGIYFLKKHQSENENSKSISVYFKENIIQSGFEDLKQSEQVESNEIKEIKRLSLNEGTDLELIDIGFPQNIDKQVSINEMFVIAFEYTHIKQIMIYSIKNTIEPVIRYEKPPLTFVDYAFIFSPQKGITYFILKSQYQNTHLEIKWKEPSAIKLDEQSSIDYAQSSKSYASDSRERLQEQQITIEKMQVNLNDQDQFEQYYFVDCFGISQLIYPFQKDKKQRDQITNFIKDHYQVKMRYKGKYISAKGNVYYIENDRIIAYLSKQGNHYQNESGDLVNFLKSAGSKFSNDYTQRLILENMIINIDLQSNLDVVIYKDDKNIEINLVSQYCKLLKSNQYFFYNQIQQFHPFNSSNENIDQYQSNDETKNHKICEMSLAKSRKHVALGNNSIIIKDKMFKVDENNLIILKENNNNPDIDILKLYAPQVQRKSYKEGKSKLIKYHFSGKHAIFFFIYRFFDGLRTKGVHFFKIISQQELSLLISNNQYLISEGTKIFIMKKIDEILLVQFDHKVVQGFSDLQKYNNASTNEFVFEMNRDLQDPTKDQFPFIFYQKESENSFEIYFCFLNVEKAGLYLINRKQKESEDGMKLSQFIQSFQIQFYQKQDEPILIKDCNDNNCGMRQSVLAHRLRSNNMFCRSSNWQKTRDYFQAKFQVGFNIESNDLQAIEVREYLVRVNLKNDIDVNPIAIKLITFDNNYINNIIRAGLNYKQTVENHRLISQIDDDGNIEGSMLIFNHKQSRNGIWKITDDVQVIKQLHQSGLDISSSDQEEKADEQVDFQNLANELSNSYFFVTSKIYSFEGYSSSGKYYKGLKNGILTQQINDSTHIYDLINLNDIDLKLDICNSVQNNMCKSTIQKNEFISISTVTLSEDCLDSYFSAKQLLYWLYHFQKNLMSSRQIYLNDMFYANTSKIDKNFYQPCMILGGKNKFYLNRKTINISQINSLISLDLQDQTQSNIHIQNSIIDLASTNNVKYLENMEVSYLYDCQSDLYKKVSILQCLIDANKIKEVVYFATQIIKNKPNKQSFNMLVQDLPMLMEFQKVDLNEVFNISPIEESSLTLNIDQQNEKDKTFVQFNLEQSISNSILKVFGPEEQLVYNPSDFKGMNLTEEEMVEILYEGNQNLTEEEIQKEILLKGKLESEASQVWYSCIFFEEMIRKIQIDLILQRSTKYCEYLEFFQPGNIVKCSHLFLAIMINKCQEVGNFFEQNTTQNIIDIQFKYTREEIKKYLIIYVLGFFIPYVYNSLSLNEIENLQEESYFHFYLRWALYIICSFTQIYFLILEFPEIYYNSFQNYISEVYNLFDLNLPLLFAIHLVLRAIYGKVTGFGWMQLFDNIVEILIMIGSTLKLLQYIRYKEEFSYFVQMFFSVLVELIPFLLVFLIFILVFTVFQIILGAQVPADGSDYPGVHQYQRMLFHTFRTSVGDLQVLNYSKWADDASAENPSFSTIARLLVVALVWAFWIFDIYLILIVMLNLLIAQVGQIYEKIMSQGKTSIYKERAQLNLKVFQTKYYFGELHEFVALIMQTPSQNTDSFNFDDFTTFTERVKKSTQNTVDKMQNTIRKDMNLMKSSLQNKIGSIDNKIDNLVKQIEKIFQNQIEQNKVQIATEQKINSQIDSSK